MENITREDVYLIIIGIQLFLLIVAGVLLFIQMDVKPKNKGKNKKHSSDTVSRDRFDEISREKKQLKSELEDYRKECRTYQKKYAQLDDLYGKACIEINRIKSDLQTSYSENKELKRKIAELEKPLSANSAVEDKNNPHWKFSFSESSSNKATENNPKEENQEQTEIVDAQDSSETLIAEPVKDTSNQKEDSQVIVSNDAMKYASFPRSAADRIYFSDLTEKRADDSFFEISISGNKASFKPLDFLKIRNYDDAMIAMLTEGAKPNVASSVIGIEPGSAHLEGKDWIIDKQAKIKLA